MHLKKCVALVLASSGLFTLGMTTCQHPAHAATWHKGVPKFLRGHFYRTKLEPKYVKMNGKKVPINSRRSEDLHFTKTKVRYLGYQDAANLKGCHYTHKGKYIIIKGKYDKDMGLTPALKVKKISNKVIYAGVDYYTNSTTPNFSQLKRMTRQR